MTAAHAKSTFDTLYESEYDFVCHTLRRLGAREGDIDDIAQEVFIQFFNKQEQYDFSRSVRPLLTAFCFRLLQNHRRRAYQDREQPCEQVERPSSRPGPEEVLVDRQRSSLLMKALEEVPSERRVVLMMHELEGCSVKEVAEHLDVPLHTVYSRLRKGREELRHQLRGHRFWVWPLPILWLLERRARAQFGASASVAATSNNWLASTSAALARRSMVAAFAAGAGTGAVGMFAVDQTLEQYAFSRPQMIVVAAPATVQEEAPPTAIDKPASTDKPLAVAEPLEPPVNAQRTAKPRTASSHTQTPDANKEKVEEESGHGAELAILDGARGALTRNQAEQALRAVARHNREFPDSSLGEEREHIRILALIALGREAQASRFFGRFIARYPQSIHLPRLRKALQSAPNTP